MRAWLGTRYSRLVSRFVPDAIARLPRPRSRTWHLTFDDGPTEATPELLDVLDEFDVPATFFLLGEQARQWPQYVEEIVRRGHEIGNHSLTHVDAWKVEPEVVEREFDETSRLLADLVGQPIRTTRPPFGRLNKAVVRWCRRNDQQLLMWDLMPPDFEETKTADDVSRVLERGLRRGSIVVLHDNEKARGKTAAALRRTLPLLRERGWTPVPRPEAPADDAAATPRAA